MGEFVTHEELRTALEVERGHTKNVIDAAVKATADRHDAVLGEIRVSMREVQKEAALAAAGYGLLKTSIDERFGQIAALIEAHDGPIRRLKIYEKAAVGVANAVIGMPFWNWLRKGLAWIAAIGGGAALGSVLFRIALGGL